MIARPSADAQETSAALRNKANASQVGGLKTAVHSKADESALAEALARIEALEARVAALEA